MYKSVPFLMLFYSHLCLKVGYADITYQKKKKKSRILIWILLLLTSTRNSVDCVDGSIVEDIECFDLVDVTLERSFDGSQDNESSECFKCPLEKVILSFLWHRASIKTCIVVVSTNSNM